MSEFSIGRGVILNGKEQIGRSRQSGDGTFAAFDFCDANWGDEITVSCRDETRHVLAKTEMTGDVLTGWTYRDALEGDREGALELSDPPFRHLGVVAREGLALAFIDKENTRLRLGVVAAITHCKIVSTNE